MSKFINTQHKVTIDSLVDGFKENIKNPYYIHSDRQPFIVTYYNQNLEMSTLDEFLKIEYSALGENSPFKYKKINNFYLYGIERILNDLENGEWGLESNSIEGDAVILPNTIIPIANDYFVINHIDKALLFKVTNVTPDTIENGANFYKISYKLDQLSDESINKQVTDEFEMVINNLGTQFKSIIRTNDYNYIEKIDSIFERLKDYYCELFYSKRVQTFTLYHNGHYFYDPYLIEFLLRNKILKNSQNYIYITHQTTIPSTFSIDYDKTFFRFVEFFDLKNTRKPRIYSQADIIDEYLSILNFREEDYFKIKYINNESIVDYNNPIINNFNAELLERIYDNKLYDNTDYRNIIIKYFNNKKIEANDIMCLEYIEFEHNIELFYNIPVILHIINNNIEKILRTNI